jgi:RNA polymerase sigma-70 factor (ECF subfamily)
MDDRSALPPRRADARLDDAWRDHRRRLLDIAYRMLGSVSDAEDVVQEAYARLVRSDLDRIDDVRGWLITVTGRLCLDHLRSADVRRRTYVGPWLPEPLVELPAAGLDPADRVTLDDSVRMALLVLLEQLSPAERTAFVLHDVFQVPFDEVGAIVGRSAAACRQLAARARRRVQSEAGPARFHVDASEQRRVAERFAAACANGDFEALLEVLDPDVVGEFDSGGFVPGAPQQAIVGRAEVLAQLQRTFAHRRASFTVARVNGEPGVVITRGDRIISVVALHLRKGRIDHIHGVGNPAKLSHLLPPRARQADD